jgi:oxalate decarboxylase/phosphoglucose isomerase-like protein (cupin superfamily)
MKHFSFTSSFFIVLSTLVVFSCNQETKKDEQPEAQSPKSTFSYDAAMDPMNVEAANVTNKFGDTLGIKFYEVSIKPGDTALIHTHPDYTLYIAEGGTLRITPKDAEPQTIDFKTGSGFIFPEGAHSGKNIGTTTIKLVVTDIYRPK